MISLNTRYMDEHLYRTYFEKDSAFTGTVHSVYKTLINVETADGDIFAISHLKGFYVPFMIQISEEVDFSLMEVSQGIVDSEESEEINDIEKADRNIEKRDLEPIDETEERLIGRKVTYEQGKLVIERIFTLEMDDAVILERPVKTVPVTEGLSSATSLSKKILLEQGKRGGCISYFGNYPDMDIYERELAQRISDLKNTDAFHRLIGLGRGLTPSGDDFILGLLCAVYHHKNSCKEHLSEELRKAIIAYGHNTTDVSRQMLRLGMEDHFSGPLMDLCACITAGKSQNECYSSMMKLLNIGSTSGADMATGVIFAMEMALKNEKYGGKHV